MSEKKRTTVTTIETHEVWIIRKDVPASADERDKEMAQHVVPSLSKPSNSSDTDLEENYAET